MSLAFNIEADTLDQSSFSTLIRQEEQEELVHIDVYTACLIGDIDAIKGRLTFNFRKGITDILKHLP